MIACGRTLSHYISACRKSGGNLYQRQFHADVTKTLGRLTISLTKLMSVVEENPGKFLIVSIEQKMGNFIFDLNLKDQKMFGMDNKIDCIVRKFLETAENNYELTTR